MSRVILHIEVHVDRVYPILNVTLGSLHSNWENTSYCPFWRILKEEYYVPPFDDVFGENEIIMIN